MEIKHNEYHDKNENDKGSQTLPANLDAMQPSHLPVNSKIHNMAYENKGSSKKGS